MAHTLRISSAERREGGRWLKKVREAAGITQREVAAVCSFDYYTIISQIEAGKARIPPDRYAAYARALKMEPQDFVKELLRYYDPDAYRILWPKTRRGSGLSLTLSD
jgi:transcriptional regulator with XRE-family HTH domain